MSPRCAWSHETLLGLPEFVRNGWNWMLILETSMLLLSIRSIDPLIVILPDVIKWSRVQPWSRWASANPQKGFLAIDDDPDPLCRLPHWQDPLHWASLDWVKRENELPANLYIVSTNPEFVISSRSSGASRAKSWKAHREAELRLIPTMIEQIGSRFSRSGSGSVKHQSD